MIIHKVRTGDTLNSIANEHNISPELIILQNDLPNPDNLVVGQELAIFIPSAVYTVKSGDTLSSVSSDNDISLNSLLRLNPWLISMPLYPDMTVILSYEGSEQTQDIVANGYTYTDIQSEQLRKAMPYLSLCTVFTYGFDKSGSLIEPSDSNVLAIINEYGITPVMLLSTLTADGTFSNALAGEILNNETAQNILIENIKNTMTNKGYRGLDIDFEYLPVEDRDKYASFVEKLTSELNKSGYITLVALAPKVSANQPGLLYEGHDYFALGRAANLALAMTYEWGYTYGPPMAVSPINEVEKVISYAVSEINPQKLLMGIPLYGYDFKLPYIRGTSRAVSLSPQQAIELAVKTGSEISYDETAQAPYFYYTADDKSQHIVWFENASSTIAKLNLVKKYKLAGVSYWSLNRSFPQAFMILNNEFRILQ